MKSEDKLAIWSFLSWVILIYVLKGEETIEWTGVFGEVFGFFFLFACIYGVMVYPILKLYGWVTER